MLNLLLDQATRTCLGRRAFGLQRGAALILGARRRPNRLPRNGETLRQSEVEALRRRLGRRDLIPGLTVHQAKGCEWNRVGVALRQSDRDLLSQGLRELEPEHCVLYVALTRARRMCGWLGGVEQLEPDVDDVADASSV